jgi:hypothetical protein
MAEGSTLGSLTVTQLHALRTFLDATATVAAVAAANAAKAHKNGRSAAAHVDAESAKMNADKRAKVCVDSEELVDYMGGRWVGSKCSD